MSKHTTGITVADWLKSAQIKLGKSSTANLDTRLLVAHVLGWDPSQVLAHPETLLGPDQIEKLERIYKLRRGGTPMAYILGYKDFADFRVMVTPDVLIPRPETESILQTAIEIANQTNAKEIYEIGTGSGVIAIGLARALPDAKIIASDISSEALGVAEQNIKDLRVEDRIDLIQADLGEHINHANLLVANLPYLPVDLKVSSEVKKEPDLALWSGKDGLDHYRKLLIGTSFDTAIIELGANQYQPLVNWLRPNMANVKTEPIQDLSGMIVGMVIKK